MGEDQFISIGSTSEMVSSGCLRVVERRVTPTECRRSSQRSARSTVSEKTEDTDCSISTDSLPKLRSLAEVSSGCWGVDEFKSAQRLGRARINDRTLAFACSGNPAPAYLVMTSTTLRNVSMTSFLMAANAPDVLVETVVVEVVVVVLVVLVVVGEPVAMDTTTFRRRDICCWIC